MLIRHKTVTGSSKAIQGSELYAFFLYFIFQWRHVSFNANPVSRAIQSDLKPDKS